MFLRSVGPDHFQTRTFPLSTNVFRNRTDGTGIYSAPAGVDNVILSSDSYHIMANMQKIKNMWWEFWMICDRCRTGILLYIVVLLFHANKYDIWSAMS